MDLERFFVLRAIKIYPSFWALMLVTLAAYGLRGDAVPLRALLCELLFVQNYGPGLWAHTWSLAVEEHFYVGLAVMFGLWSYAPRPKPRRPLVYLLSALLLLLALRGLTQCFVPWHYKATTWGSHVRGDALVFGAGLAYLYGRHREELSRVITRFHAPLLLLAACLLGSVFAVECDSAYVRYLGYSALYLGYGIVMLCYLFLGRAPGWLARGFLFLGRYSYGIYLWHPVVQRLIMGPLQERGWLPPGTNDHFVAVSCAGVIVGIAMTHLVEAPMLVWREYRFPASDGKAPQSAPPPLVRSAHRV